MKYSRFELARAGFLMRYDRRTFDESKVKRDDGGKFSVQQGHYAPEGADTEVGGIAHKPGTWIHTHQIRRQTPEHAKAHEASLGGRELGEQQFRDQHGAKFSPELENEIKNVIGSAVSDVKLSRNEHGELKGDGKSVSGKRVTMYPDSHTDRQQAQKEWRLLNVVEPQLPRIRQRFDDDWKTSGNEAALLGRLIEKTGMRISSEKKTGARVKSYGATTLKPEHVTIDGDHISFDFIGKSGKLNHYEATDKTLADEFSKRIAAGDQKLFKINDTKYRQYMHGVAPDIRPAHDFRLAVCTADARQQVDSMPMPNTMDEYKSAMTTAVRSAAKRINDTDQMAYDKYIAKEVFSKWRKHLEQKGIDPSEWKPTFPASKTKTSGGEPSSRKSKPPKAPTGGSPTTTKPASHGENQSTIQTSTAKKTDPASNSRAELARAMSRYHRIE